MFHALGCILRDEGGLYNLFFASTRLGATLLYHVAHSSIKFLIPWIVEHVFRVSPDRKVLYGLTEFALSTGYLIIMMPISTCLRRLQCQTVYPDDGLERGAKNDPYVMRGVVPLAQHAAYKGFWDCCTRIVREESCVEEVEETEPTSKLSLKRWLPQITPGVWSLYPGIRMHLLSQLLTFGVTSLSESDYDEWEEYE
jgi:hypothetical protein